MKKVIIRILFSMVAALLLGITDVEGNVVVLQTLFTVLGIVFSISMSLLVSFNLSKILNNNMRNSLRGSITHLRNMLLLDFGMSTICLVEFVAWVYYTFAQYAVAGFWDVDNMPGDGFDVEREQLSICC